jgi:hypothetical protein
MGGGVLDEFTIFKKDSLSIIKEDEIIRSFDCYPNPFSDKVYVNIKLRKKTEISLSLLNIKGQKIKTLYEGVFKSNELSFVLNKEVKDLSRGNYILSLNTSSGVHFRKVVKL